MQGILNLLIPLVSAFGGPIMGLIEKGIAAGVVWAFARGHLDPSAAPGIAAEIYLAFSGIVTAVTKSQTFKIQNVNANPTNGVKVVDARTSAPAVNAPQA